MASAVIYPQMAWDLVLFLLKLVGSFSLLSLVMLLIMVLQQTNVLVINTSDRVDPRLCFCAEAVGGAIAGLVAAPLYGVGAAWLKNLFPWHKATESPTGPHGKLVDHALSRRRHGTETNDHRPSDSASSPSTLIPGSGAEHEPLHTLV